MREYYEMEEIVSPTRVGMNRPGGPIRLADMCKPHARGDEPTVEITAYVEAMHRDIGTV